MAFDHEGLLPVDADVEGVCHGRLRGEGPYHVADGLGVGEHQRVAGVVGYVFYFVMEDEHSPFGFDVDDLRYLVADEHRRVGVGRRDAVGDGLGLAVGFHVELSFGQGERHLDGGVDVDDVASREGEQALRHVEGPEGLFGLRVELFEECLDERDSSDRDVVVGVGDGGTHQGRVVEVLQRELFVALPVVVDPGLCEREDEVVDDGVVLFLAEES